MSIPKVIHYCWFGRGEKPELIQMCIDSWLKFCPDYKIIEWNEDNFDVNFCSYTKEAYIAKKWAFVSDVARLKIISEFGGIYLDTDVELRGSLDCLLQYDAWFAQDDIRYINTGLGFGAQQGNALISQMLAQRIDRPFDMTICNAIDTPIIRAYLGMKQSRRSQVFKNIYVVGMIEYPRFGKHWENNSWKDEHDLQFQQQRRNKLWRLKCALRSPGLINWLERKGETRISKCYVFFVYDFLDNGPIYFVKRLVNKLLKK